MDAHRLNGLGDPANPAEDAAEVVAAARARAAALAVGDADALRALLHPAFGWSTHIGQRFDRDEYVDRNTTGGVADWVAQDLGEPEVIVVGVTAVLHTVVTDTVAAASGAEVFRMPMTQVWVRDESGWRCLAGHAGPRLTS